MSKSVHQIAIKGKDETAGAFSSIQGRAAAASARLRKMLGGALAAAGAYLGFRSISNTINELGNLSDIAMRAGTSVDELTKASTAFQIAGLPMSVEQLATAMQYMQKNTGKQGLGAFLETAKTIANINDGATRGKELVKNFGRAGLQLQPLVSNGADAVDKFQRLAALMPRVTDSAANAGDEIADAQKSLGVGVQSLWQRAIGKICSLWAEDFPGGVRAGALNAVNWFEYAFKKMFNVLTKWGAKIAMSGEALFSWITGEQDWDSAWREYFQNKAALDKNMDAERAKIESDRNEFIEKLKEKNVDALANLFGNKGGANGETNEMLQRSPRVTNSLVMGGSNAARRMAILGPTFQSEMKKQTETLEKIKENTEKTAENTEESGEDLEATNLGG